MNDFLINILMFTPIISKKNGMDKLKKYIS